MKLFSKNTKNKNKKNKNVFTEDKETQKAAIRFLEMVKERIQEEEDFSLLIEGIYGKQCFFMLLNQMIKKEISAFSFTNIETIKRKAKDSNVTNKEEMIYHYFCTKFDYFVEETFKKKEQCQHELTRILFKGTSTLGIETLAEHIIAIAHKEKHPITTFHLQRILFLTFGFIVKEKGHDSIFVQTLYNRPFERSYYGPINWYIHYLYVSIDPYIKQKGVVYEEFCTWNEIIRKLLKANPTYLAAVTRDMSSWRKYKVVKNKQERTFPPYTLKEIYKDFTR